MDQLLTIQQVAAYLTVSLQTARRRVARTASLEVARLHFAKGLPLRGRRVGFYLTLSEAGPD